MADGIVTAPGASSRLQHAAADFQRYLAETTGSFVPLGESPEPGVRFVFGHVGDDGPAGALVAAGRVEHPPGPEGYALRLLDGGGGNGGGDPTIAVVGSDEAGAVYGVYALLEEAYGCGFYLGSEVVPTGTASLVPDRLDVRRSPAFATRGLLPWYDFLSGPSAWNLADYRLYVDRMVRMGLNFLGLHVYSKGPVTRSQGAEPFLSFTYHGVGHDAELDTTQTARWGYLPMRTSDFAFGTDRYFAGEVLGADAAVQAVGPVDAAVRAKALLRAALTYAKERGLRVCVGFEPAAIPEEILRALPENAKRTIRPVIAEEASEEVLDLRSEAAREILRRRLDDLLDTYPMVDAVWLWQNEDAAWTARRPGSDNEVLPFDASYLNQAYDHLNARAPGVRLVVSGWGAVHGHFDELHAALPADVPFSALNHYLGASPTDDVYGRLDGRSRWPIPWLEDDATLWHPQYHLHRFHNDVTRAHQFGCDGMIGIHWRTRVIDHTAAYFARALWQPDLTPAAFYRTYAERLAGPAGAPELARALDDADRTHRWPGWFDEQTVAVPGWNQGHSNEALEAFSPLSVPDDLMRDFDAFVARLAAARDAADSPAAAERLAYHQAQAAFAQHYVQSQRAAHDLDGLTALAVREGRRLSPDETATAAQHVTALYAAVRAAVEGFAAAMTTTADLGVLASLNQKYVVRAGWQRYDALRELVAEHGSLPRPDLAAHDAVPFRVFVPVPPEAIDAEGTTVEAILSSPVAEAVTLRWAPLGGGDARAIPLAQRGRGVWAGVLRATGPVRYWIDARDAAGRCAVCPPQAPAAAFTAIPTSVVGSCEQT